MPVKRKRKFNEKGEAQILANISKDSFDKTWSYIESYNKNDGCIGRLSMSALVRLSLAEYIKNNPLP